MAHNGAPGDRDLPRQAFLKSPRTVIGPGDDIVVDERLGQVNIEGELAVVIRHQPAPHADQVPGAILGYTIGNDVTAVDQIALDEKMTQSKNGDGFTPIGPWIETDLDSGTVPMTVRSTAKTVAEANTSSTRLEHHRAAGLPHQLPHASAPATSCSPARPAPSPRSNPATTARSRSAESAP